MKQNDKYYYHKGQRIEFDSLPLYFKTKLKENDTEKPASTSSRKTTAVKGK
jgi:hypothetical protein